MSWQAWLIGGIALIVILAIVGPEPARQVLDEFAETLHKPSPEPSKDLPAPTDEELDRWLNMPAAPEPRRHA